MAVLVLRLGDTVRERGSVHVSVARVANVGVLANDEHVQWDAGGRDLEERSLWPSRARGSEQARAGGALSSALCIGLCQRLLGAGDGVGLRL